MDWKKIKKAYIILITALFIFAIINIAYQAIVSETWIMGLIAILAHVLYYPVFIFRMDIYDKVINKMIK